jgi:hypothetical protein
MFSGEDNMMNRRFFVLVFLLFFALASQSFAQSTPVRIGIITSVDEWKSAIELAMVDLLDLKGVQLLDRDQMNTALGELSLQAAGLTAAGEIQLGQHTKADALVRVDHRLVDGQNKALVSFLDLRLGAVVWVETLDVTKDNQKAISGLLVEAVRRNVSRVNKATDSLLAMTLLPVRLEESRFDHARKKNELGRILFSAFSNRAGLAILDREHISDFVYDMFFTKGATGEFWGAAVLAELVVAPSEKKPGQMVYTLTLTRMRKVLDQIMAEGTLDEADKILKEIADKAVRSMNRPQGVQDSELVREEASRFSKLAVELQYYDIHRALYYAELAWSMGDVDPKMVTLLVNFRLQEASLRNFSSVHFDPPGIPPDIKSYGIHDFQFTLGYLSIPIRFKDGRMLHSPAEAYAYFMDGLISTQDMLRPRLQQLGKQNEGWLPILTVNYSAGEMQQSLAKLDNVPERVKPFMRKNAEWFLDTLPVVWKSGWYNHKSGVYEMQRNRIWFATTPDGYFKTFHPGYGIHRYQGQIDNRFISELAAFSTSDPSAYPELALAEKVYTPQEWNQAYQRFLNFLKESVGFDQMHWLYLVTQGGKEQDSPKEQFQLVYQQAFSHLIDSSKLSTDEMIWLRNLYSSLSEKNTQTDLEIWMMFFEKIGEFEKRLRSKEDLKTEIRFFQGNWRKFEEVYFNQTAPGSLVELDNELATLNLSHSKFSTTRRLVNETKEKIKKQGPDEPEKPINVPATGYLPSPVEKKSIPFGRYHASVLTSGKGNGIWYYNPVKKELTEHHWWSGEEERRVKVPYVAERSDERLKVATMELLGCNGTSAVFKTPHVPHLGTYFVLHLETETWKAFYRLDDANEQGGWYHGIPKPSVKEVFFIDDRVLLGNEKRYICLPLRGGSPEVVLDVQDQNLPEKFKKLPSAVPWGTGSLALWKFSPDPKQNGVKMRLYILDLNSGHWETRNELLKGQLPLFYRKDLSFLSLHPAGRHLLLVGAAGVLDLAEGSYRPVSGMQRGKIKIDPGAFGDPFVEFHRNGKNEKWKLEYAEKLPDFLYAEDKLWLFGRSSLLKNEAVGDIRPTPPLNLKVQH